MTNGYLIKHMSNPIFRAEYEKSKPDNVSRHINPWQLSIRATPDTYPDQAYRYIHVSQPILDGKLRSIANLERLELMVRQDTNRLSCLFKSQEGDWYTFMFSTHYQLKYQWDAVMTALEEAVWSV